MMQTLKGAQKLPYPPTMTTDKQPEGCTSSKGPPSKDKKAATAAPELLPKQGNKDQYSTPKQKARRRYVINADFMNPTLAPRPLLDSPGPAGTGTAAIDDKVDVICGTGRCSHMYQGNCDYLEMICQHAKQLVEQRLQKDSAVIEGVGKRIVKAVRGKGGRFLKRETNETVWVDVGDFAAITKTTRQLKLAMKKLEPPMQGGIHKEGFAKDAKKTRMETAPKKKEPRTLNPEEKAKLALLPSPQREQVLKLTELHPWDVKAAVNVIHVPQFYRNGDPNRLAAGSKPASAAAKKPRTAPKADACSSKLYRNGNPNRLAAGSTPASAAAEPRTAPKADACCSKASPSPSPKGLTPITGWTAGQANTRASCPSRILEDATQLLQQLYDASKDGHQNKNSRTIHEPESHNNDSGHPSLELVRCETTVRRSLPPRILWQGATKRSKSNATEAAIAKSPSKNDLPQPPPTPLLGSTSPLPWDTPSSPLKDTLLEAPILSPAKLKANQSIPPKKQQDSGDLNLSSSPNGPFPKLNLSPESEDSMLGKGYRKPYLQRVLYNGGSSSGNLVQLSDHWQQRHTMRGPAQSSAAPEAASFPEGMIDVSSIAELQALSSFLSSMGA